MSAGTVHWERGMESLGRAVVSIGVFDGVHLGHQSLLKRASQEAGRLGARSVALTFDRDPDQVVTPQAAAPQLLSLTDKCRFIRQAGVDTVLVVPFTTELAAMEPEEFLDQVLAGSAEVVSVHVGRDFRFGAHAAGDLDTLYVWGVENGAEVRPHDLVAVSGEPVTSTRIRRLVADGAVEDAAELLGRPSRVSGIVRRGREQGRSIGFPTANILPMAFAALPADGVYAGTAELEGGESYPASISVGTPPSFPEARDYLEAHLIGFDGDLYDTAVTLSFLSRLRELRAFASMTELAAAIAADTARTAEIAAAAEPALLPEDGAKPFEHYREEFLEDGRPLIDDLAALEAAEAAVASARRKQCASIEQWVPVTEPRHLSGLFGEAGYTAAMIVAPLEAAGIQYMWDPYAPEDMPSYRYGYGVIDRTFTLLVPESRVDEARLLLGVGRAVPSPSAPQQTQISPADASGKYHVVPGDAVDAAPGRPTAVSYVTWIVIAAFLFFMLFRVVAR
jgi:riboflavin kinase / FMN adenylyltransferase